MNKEDREVDALINEQTKALGNYGSTCRDREERRRWEEKEKALAATAPINKAVNKAAEDLATWAEVNHYLTLSKEYLEDIDPKDLATPTGLKYDTDKLPLHLLPFDSLSSIAEVLQFGAAKYSERNWENGISYSRLFSATLRHLTAWFQHREDNDPETNLSHVAHAGCCILFLLAHVQREELKKFDDRPTIK